MNYQQLYIDGQWIAPARGGSFETFDPSDESLLARVGAATAEDIDTAVKAARAAFDDGPWPNLAGAERAAVLRRIAQGIRGRQRELAELEVRDNGKPLPEALWDIDDTAGCFDFYADLAERLDTNRERQIALADERFSAVARREPVGVAGAIIPWNFPMLMASWKVAPALAAGCCMVLKPSELTPLSALHLAEIAHEAGLPAGVLNVVTGLGADAGAPLAEHPDIDKLAFTGSVPTGSRIMQAAARDIKNISLELGGKSPFVIFADSDLEAAVEWILFGIFWNQGEVCSATSRVLVERACTSPARTPGRGSPQNHHRQRPRKGVLLGPLVNRTQYDKVLQAIARGHGMALGWSAAANARPAWTRVSMYSPRYSPTCRKTPGSGTRKFWAGGLRAPFRRREGSRTFGQRLALRPGCRSDVPRPAALPARRPPPSCRNRLDQLLAADFHRGALGWLQAQRHRTRAGRMGPRQLPGNQADHTLRQRPPLGLVYQVR